MISKSEHSHLMEPCHRFRDKHKHGLTFTKSDEGALIMRHLRLILITLLQLSILIQCLDESQSNESSGKCPPNWSRFNQKCYKVFYNPRQLAAAKSRCNELSSQLAVVDDETTKEEEPTSGQGGNSSVFTFLTTLIKTDASNRYYHVGLGSDLVRQYKSRVQLSEVLIGHRPGLRGGDLSEHVDLDYTGPDLWIPNDDKDLQHVRYNHTTKVSNTSEPLPAFVLAFSKDHTRWGLLPFSPTKKALFICEMPPQAQNNELAVLASNQPATSNQHQTIERKKQHDQGSSSSRSPGPATSPASTTSSTTSTATSSQAAPASQSSKPTEPPAGVTSANNNNNNDLASTILREVPQSQSIVLGSTSEMRCSSIEPDASLSWTFNGRNLTQSNRLRQHPNGWLRIEHVRNSDGGNYTCTIHSSGLTESRTARLEIVERPHQPEYITSELLDKLSTSVRIRWTPGFNGNSPILKYLVEMRTVNGDGSSSGPDSGSDSTSQTQGAGQWEVAKANISADQTSVIIADLKPARKYIFRIRATNRVGTGDPSVPTRNPIEVPVQPPSMPPENLAGTPRSAISISVQWSPPPADSQNGPIKGYKVRHKLAGYASDADWYTNDVPETSHLTYVLEDLITWQNYEIQVAAENDKGVGPFSSSVFIRTKEGRPDKGPRSVQAEAVSPSIVKVNWNPPPPQHIYGVNQGYRVQIWLDSQQSLLAKEAVVQHNSLTPLQTATLNELQPYTEYHVTVKCFTNAGDGVPNEEAVSVRTKQDLPEAVASLGFADVLDKSLRVVWKAPKRINGELSHYTLEYSESSSTDRRTLKKYPAGTTEAKIVDLSPQTSYTFKIYPHTDAGQGPDRTSNITTSVPPVLPEPPSNLTPISVGPYSVTIQFEPGFDGNAAIERWIAEALTPSNGDYKARWQNIYISTNHTQGNTVVVRNLRPYTRYRIRLTPANVVGASRYPSEETQEFQTSQIEPEQAPKDLSVDDVRSNSAVVHWSPLSNNLWLGQARGYNVTWSESNNSTLLYQLINDTRADSFLVGDLEEFTEYTFKIHALNEAGSSPPSEGVTIVTQEDAPSSGPINVTAQALSATSVSVNWNPVPRRHRNGLIRGYKIQYQAVKPDAPLLHRTIEDNSTKHVTLNDLKAYTAYHLAVAAYTAAGDGVYSPVISVQTLEDTPGLPQNLSSPTVSQTSARILWDPPEDPNGDILGYKVTYHSLAEDNKEAVHSQELQSNERTFKVSNLKPRAHYVFTVTAKTKEGWGQQASMLLYTFDSELRANLPFFRESWFVILCACSSVVITIIVTALLFIQTKSYKYKQNAIKSTSQDRLGDAGFTIDDEVNSHYNNGFGLLSGNATHRRSHGALSQSTAHFTLPKTPPRPHPGSAVYSDNDHDDDEADDGDDDVFDDPVDKPPIKKSLSNGGASCSGLNSASGAGTSQNYDDSSGDSLTEKPSEISSSPAPESPESNDDEYVNMANKHFVSHYANVNGTLRSQRSWRRGQPGASTSSATSTSKIYGGLGGKAAGSSGHHHHHSRLTKPKLPQRPAPSVPQVPPTNGIDLIQQASSSSDTAGSTGQQLPVPPMNARQHQQSSNHYMTSNQQQNSKSIYGETPTANMNNPIQPQSSQTNTRTHPSNHPMHNRNNGTSVVDGPVPIHAQPNGPAQENGQHQQNTQQPELLNNHMINLNGGRIIVDNMAGSRAPLPGFTSFV